MGKTTSNNWNLIFKWVSLILAIMTILVGVFQFKWAHKHQIEQLSINDSINFANKVWEKKLEVYTRLSSAIGKIISMEENEEMNKQYLKEFEHLYYGEGILVEDDSVEMAMVNFKATIRSYREGDCDLTELKQVGEFACKSLKKINHISGNN